MPGQIQFLKTYMIGIVVQIINRIRILTIVIHLIGVFGIRQQGRHSLIPVQ